MRDLLFETIALKRIALFTRLIASNECSADDKDVAIAWLEEMTSDLLHELDCYSSRPLKKDSSHGLN